MKQVEFINQQIEEINDKNYSFIYNKIEPPLIELSKTDKLQYTECLHKFCYKVSDKMDKNSFGIGISYLTKIFNKIKEVDTNYYVSSISYLVNKLLEANNRDLSIIDLEINPLLSKLTPYKYQYLDLSYKICLNIINDTNTKNLIDNTKLVSCYVKNIEALSKTKAGNLVNLFIEKQLGCITSSESLMFCDSNIQLKFDELLLLNPALYPKSLKSYVCTITKYSNLNNLATMYTYLLKQIHKLKTNNEKLYFEYIYLFAEKKLSNNYFSNEEFKILFNVAKKELTLISKNNIDAYNQLCYKACISVIEKEYKLDLHDKLIHSIFINMKSSFANEVLEQIKKMYKIEKKIKGNPPKQRLKIRQQKSKKLVDELFDYMKVVYEKLFKNSPTAKAIKYTLNNEAALKRYLNNGRLEIDNNAAERAMRPIAVGRKNWIFAGADTGGKTAAIIYTLIETAKLNNVNPWKYLHKVLTIIQDYTASKIDDLLPWNLTLDSS